MKTEIPQWILDQSKRKTSAAKAIKALLAIIEKLESGKPDWKDAPEWAEWLAQDYDGVWWWYAEKPVQDKVQWILTNWQKLPIWANTDARTNPEWKETLEKRPTHEEK